MKIQRRLAKTKAHYKFLLCLERNESQTFNSSILQKTFSPVCIILVQISSINVFYSIWWLEDSFFIKVYRYLEFRFNCHVFGFFETSDLREVRSLLIISRKSLPKSSSRMSWSSHILDRSLILVFDGLSTFFFIYETFLKIVYLNYLNYFLYKLFTI